MERALGERASGEAPCPRQAHEPAGLATIASNAGTEEDAVSSGRVRPTPRRPEGAGAGKQVFSEPRASAKTWKSLAVRLSQCAGAHVALRPVEVGVRREERARASEHQAEAGGLRLVVQGLGDGGGASTQRRKKNEIRMELAMCRLPTRAGSSGSAVARTLAVSRGLGRLGPVVGRTMAWKRKLPRGSPPTSADGAADWHVGPCRVAPGMGEQRQAWCR